MKFTVRFPPYIEEVYKSMTSDENLKDYLMKNKNLIAISFSGGKLRMETKYVEGFFAQSIDKTADHLSNLLEQNDVKDISTIILVGGYSESQMLVKGIKSMFPKMNTLVPKDAAWSVLCGAVIFGHDPSLISQRRSKYTYGI